MSATAIAKQRVIFYTNIHKDDVEWIRRYFNAPDFDLEVVLTDSLDEAQILVTSNDVGPETWVHIEKRQAPVIVVPWGQDLKRIRRSSEGNRLLHYCDGDRDLDHFRWAVRHALIDAPELPCPHS